MKKVFDFLSNSILLLLFLFVGSSCTSDDNTPEISSVDNTPELPSDKIEIKGVPTYISKIGEIVKHEETRSVNEEQTETVSLLVKESINFLQLNDVDYEEFFSDNSDPRIAVYAIAIAELQKTEAMQTTTRTSLGGCVLEGLGIRSLITGRGAVRAIGKIIARRAIPYVGWAFFAIDMAMCLAE